MTPDPSHAVAVVFLSDLRLVSSVGALGAYGFWLLTGRSSAASLARLALVVVLLGSLGMMGLAGLSELPLREWFLVAWVMVWLLGSLVFNLAALGGAVAAGAVLLIGWSYVAPAGWGGASGADVPDLVRYWSSLRDALAAVGAACVSLAIGAGVVRAVVGDRRTSQAYAPTDLVAVASLYARLGAGLAALGLLAAGLAWRHDPGGGGLHLVRGVGMAWLLGVALAWLTGPRAGLVPAWRLVLLAVLGGGACGWLFAGARLAAYLTPGIAAP
ncbi:MAG: hypothetical protein VKS61_02490 [Candidatus Sericytochromatia bacterium]|nr:hypothetical protein [Candidatus Sericytochromatia bacterium]